MALSQVRTELDELLKSQVISVPLQFQLWGKLDTSIKQTNAEIAAIYTEEHHEGADGNEGGAGAAAGGEEGSPARLLQ